MVGTIGPRYPAMRLQVRFPEFTGRPSTMITHGIHCTDLFPVPLLIDDLGAGARELNLALVADIEREMRRAPAPVARSFVAGWQSEPGLERRYASFASLYAEIDKCARTYLQHIRYMGPRRAVCSGLWANCMTERGSHSEMHIHGAGDVVATGVYYPTSLAPPGGPEAGGTGAAFDPASVFASTGVGGELILYDPSYATKRQIIRPERSRYYEALKQIAPRESLLVMFPHYLPHAVSPLLGDGCRRLSISFAVELRD